MGEYRIWWSPVGHPNGSMNIKAESKREARDVALVEMRKRNDIGACGAEPIESEDTPQ